MEEQKNYTIIDKSKITEYIYNLLDSYNTTYKNLDNDPYKSYLIMKLDNNTEIIIPEKIRKECIISWHNKIQFKKFNLDRRFFINIFSLSIGILLIILFLYILSSMRVITKYII